MNMFKFGFDLDDADIDTEIDSFLRQAGDAQPRGTFSNVQNEHPEKAISGEHASFVELSMDHLLNSLPTRLSYSPLEVLLSPPSSSASSASLAQSSATRSPSHYFARRDLFDARFQVISEEGSNLEIVAAAENDADRKKPIDAYSDSRLQFLDTPSDLVPGVYEGGLKTWECSMDLVDYLHANMEDENLEGQRILELGCGTGLPSLYLLQRIFSSPPTESTSEKTIIHFQDYNSSVLELVTFPNVLLTWYMSPASKDFLLSRLLPSNSEADGAEYPTANPADPGDIPITSSLQSAFKQSLKKYNVELRFFGGSWKNFQNAISANKNDIQMNQAQHMSAEGLGRYDIILTSETIYRTESIPELIDVIWEATHSSISTSCASEQLSGLIISKPRPPLILVAAKVLYFGVGGGVDEFVENLKRWNSVPNMDTQVTTVWEKNVGVGRKIVRVFW